MMATDMGLLKNKIEFYLKLSSYNQSDRLREFKKIAANIMNKMSEIYSLDPSKPSTL
jgi:hypothetical protein